LKCQLLNDSWRGVVLRQPPRPSFSALRLFVPFLQELCLDAEVLNRRFMLPIRARRLMATRFSFRTPEISELLGAHEIHQVTQKADSPHHLVAMVLNNRRIRTGRRTGAALYFACRETLIDETEGAQPREFSWESQVDSVSAAIDSFFSRLARYILVSAVSRSASGVVASSG